jgi:hypothetical protein
MRIGILFFVGKCHHLNIIPFPLTERRASTRRHTVGSTKYFSFSFSFFPRLLLLLLSASRKCIHTFFPARTALLLCLRLGRSTSGLCVHLSLSLLLCLLLLFRAFASSTHTHHKFLIYSTYTRSFALSVPCALILVRFYDDYFHHLTFSSATLSLPF